MPDETNIKPAPAFSLVIPVYNEKGNIADTFAELSKLLDKDGGAKPEIIFVNDGSTDGSGEIIASLAGGHGHVRVLHHRTNRGYGAALKTGIAAAASEIIVITDADSTYPNQRIPELVGAMADNDMVVGSRTGENVKIPLVRRPAKWAITVLANYLSRTRIPDLNSGLRAMRKGVITRFMNILPDGFSFTTTITLAMLTNGYRVTYVPIDYFRRGGRSKIRPIKDTLNFLQLIVRTVLYFDPLRIFLPMSALLILASLTVFGVSFFYMEKILDTTTAVLFIGGIQVLAIGMLADLIDKRSK